jgi:tyrosine aminotransferase
MSITALSEPGQNILIPCPGFGLYTCLAGARGLDCRLYRLVPDRLWEVDLEDLESKIDSQTAAIIVNNPSNPCGSSYSRQHLCDILAVAERHRLPIIADETYAWMEFPGQEFHMLSSLSVSVPILSCSTMAKRWMIPGWRQGWIIIHDRHNAFRDEVTPGLARLATKILGPNTLVQAAIPDIVAKVPAEYHQQNARLFHANARHIVTILGPVPGLEPVMPQATMYCMVLIHLEHFPDFETDLAFTRSLVVEQSVFCLPGPGFNTSGCFRIVLACPEDCIQEACHRIATFCKSHYKD